MLRLPLGMVQFPWHGNSSIKSPCNSGRAMPTRSGALERAAGKYLANPFSFLVIESC